MAAPFWKATLLKYFPVLTFRKDSLLIQTTLAAAAYYAPQDAAFLTLMGLHERSEAQRFNGTFKTRDLESDYQAFLRQKGLIQREFFVQKKKRRWQAEYA